MRCPTVPTIPGIGGAAVGGVSFTPASLSPAVWYQADAITGKTDGQAISQWNDLSGNANHAVQATGSLQPLYRTAILNGKPVVRFDGVDDLLDATAVSIAQPSTIYVAFVLRAIDGTTEMVYDGTVSRQVFYREAGAAKFDIYAGTVLQTVVTPVVDTAYVARAVFNGVSSSVKVNTTTLAGAAGATALTGLRLGNDPTGTTNPAQVDIGEFLAFSGAHSAGNLTAVEGYLGSRWGVAV